MLQKSGTIFEKHKVSHENGPVRTVLYLTLNANLYEYLCVLLLCGCVRPLGLPAGSLFLWRKPQNTEKRPKGLSQENAALLTEIFRQAKKRGWSGSIKYFQISPGVFYVAFAISFFYIRYGNYSTLCLRFNNGVLSTW